MEATLFGYERPAFTSGAAATPGYFEEATGGTLVLDELGELSSKLQASLLRVLQERTFSRLGSVTQRTSDFRLICTSSTSLEGRVKAGDFRSDLYYRINVNLLRVPPLREQREDIVSLALLFDQFNSKFGKAAGPFVPEALAALEAADWTGNVRELKHVIERAVVVNARGPIIVADLGLGGRVGQPVIMKARGRLLLRKPGSASSGPISSTCCIRSAAMCRRPRGNRIFRGRHCIAI